MSRKAMGRFALALAACMATSISSAFPQDASPSLAPYCKLDPDRCGADAEVSGGQEDDGALLMLRDPRVQEGIRQIGRCLFLNVDCEDRPLTRERQP